MAIAEPGLETAALKLPARGDGIGVVAEASHGVLEELEDFGAAGDVLGRVGERGLGPGDMERAGEVPLFERCLEHFFEVVELVSHPDDFDVDQLFRFNQAVEDAGLDPAFRLIGMPGGLGRVTRRLAERFVRANDDAERPVVAAVIGVVFERFGAVGLAELFVARVA